MMILEFSFGHWAQQAPPQAFQKVGKKWEWTGWMTVLIPFLVSLYYVIVMAWCFSYMIYAFNLRWGNDAASFLSSILKSLFWIKTLLILDSSMGILAEHFVQMKSHLGMLN